MCARFGSSKSCTVGTVCTLIGQVDETAGVRSTNHEGFVLCFAKPALLGVEVEVSFAYFNLSKDGIPGKIISIHYILAPDTHAPLASSFKDSGLRVCRETEVALGLMPPCKPPRHHLPVPGFLLMLARTMASHASQLHVYVKGRFR